MRNIFAKHLPYFNTGHLGTVIRDMVLAGPPTIRCMEHKGELYALEGSHRTAAAHYLGLTPKVIILEPDSEATGCDEFFERIAPTLPAYGFDFVLALRESAFWTPEDRAGLQAHLQGNT